MFRRYGRYRHTSCSDLDIEVNKVMFRDAKRTKLKVTYVLQRNSYSLHLSERVEIKKADYWKWKEVVGCQGFAPCSPD